MTKLSDRIRKNLERVTNIKVGPMEISLDEARRKINDIQQNAQQDTNKKQTQAIRDLEEITLFDLWQEDRISEDLRSLLQRATIVEKSSPLPTAKNFKIEFTSLILSFFTCNDLVSRWFQIYVKRNNISVKKILNTKELTLEKLNEIQGIVSTNQVRYEELEPLTSSVNTILNVAIGLMQSTSAKRDNKFDVRHVMGSYIYSKHAHEQQLEKWQFNLKNWSNSFLTMLNDQYPDEIEHWKDRHRERFNEEPMLEIGPSAHIATDEWTLEDMLGYSYYAHAIARFLTHPQTKPPLCISIQAPWGGGKTSLMRMVQYELDPEAAVKRNDRLKENVSVRADINKPEDKISDATVKISDLKHTLEHPETIKTQLKIKSIDSKQKKVNPRVTIWFNAWKYQSTEQIWAGLADAIVQQVAARLENPKDRELFLFELNKRRYGADRINQRIDNYVLNVSHQKARPWWIGSIGGVIGSSILAVIGRLDAIHTFPAVGIGGIIASVGIGVGQTFIQQYLVENKTNANESLKEYVNVPDYSKNLGFIHDAVEDLQMVFDIIKNKQNDEKKVYLPMVIFIDDLDRCSPDKVANVIEAINLFLAGDFSDCMFVMGMDPEIVAASLEEAHNRIIAKLPKFSSNTPIGWRFMDKFVQLPVVIPPPQTDDIHRYVDNLLSQNETYSVAREIANKLEKLDYARDVEQIANEAYKEHEIINDTDRKLVKQEIEKRIEKSKRYQKIDEDVDKYSDEDRIIRGMISEATSEFSDNPRELKRLMNVFRFQYFLLLARQNGGLNVPSNKQLARWIILSMKWPGLARWIHGHRSLIEYQGDSSLYHKQLKELENIAEECIRYNNIADQIWKARAESLFGLNSEEFPWITDTRLRTFFEREVKGYTVEERLSASVKNGFY